MQPELGPRTSANEILAPRADEARPEDDRPRPRMSRGRRQAYTFASLFVVVLVIGLVAAGVYWRSGAVNTHTLADAAALCPEGTTTDPANVQVAIYNSTERVGLARNTSASLVKRRFNVINDGNYAGKPVTGVATIAYGMYGRAQAQTVALEIKGKVKLVDDGRTNTLVSVVLGKKFAGLRSAGSATAAIARKPAPKGCVQPDPNASLAAEAPSEVG